MFLTLPYAYSLRCRERRKAGERNRTIRSEVAVKIGSAAENGVEIAGLQVNDHDEVQLYYSYGGKLFLQATYRRGLKSVKADEFQRLVDLMPSSRESPIWNEHDFPKPRESPLYWNNFIDASRIEELEIRERIADDQETRAIEAATFYGTAIMQVNGGILMQAPEPVWRIQEERPGVWAIKLDTRPTPRWTLYQFAITDRCRAREFITRFLDGRIDSEGASHFLEKRPRGGESDIGAIAQMIIQEHDLNGEFSMQAAAGSRIYAILSADELLKRRPQWLAGAAQPFNERLRLRWLFEREKLDSESWWLDYLASVSDLDGLTLG